MFSDPLVVPGFSRLKPGLRTVNGTLVLNLHMKASRIECLDQLLGVKVARDLEGVTLRLGRIAGHAIDFLDGRLDAPAAGTAAIVSAGEGKRLHFAFGDAAV